MVLAREAGLDVTGAWLWFDARWDSVRGLSKANERISAAVDSANIDTDF